MQPNWQIPRPGLFWLLLTFAALVALHAGHLPLWLIGAALMALLWRIQIFRGVWPSPRWPAKTALVLFCLAGIFFQYRSLSELEPLTVLLVSGLSLKLLEMHDRRDALILVYLAYFVAIVQSLFLQTIGTALQVVAVMVLITAALAGIHQTQATRHYAMPVKSGVIMLAQALPLMLVMFLLMPRIGSLWSVPQPTMATLGMSDRMSPGDFSRFGATADVAFRVEFEGDIPPQSQLYWRALVLSRFDGREWSSAGLASQAGQQSFSSLRWAGRPGSFDNDADIQRLGNRHSYTVTQEASGAHWAFALATPVPQTSGMALTRDSTLLSVKPAVSKVRYQVTSWLDYRLQKNTISPLQRAQETYLPPRYNPQTLAIARQWAVETPQPEALLKRVLALFNREYVYSLEAPALGEHAVDDFLWGTRTGFCEHFASGFVVFMRAAGIPARVVVGYQGGERNTAENYLIVHQYDAHAWAEVWLSGRGWVRVDPTAAVAPERIEMTVVDLLSGEEGFLVDSPFSAVQFNHIGWVRKLRLKIDALDYAWAKWVLGYSHMQEGLLAGILGEASPRRIGMLLLVAGAVAMMPIIFWFVWAARGTSLSELDRLFLVFCEHLKKAGIERRKGEGMRSLSARAGLKFPELAVQTQDIAKQFELYKYRGLEEDLRELHQLIKSYRPGSRRFPQ